MKKLSLLLFVFLGLLLTQCKKENPHVWNNPNPPTVGGTGGHGITYSINKGAAITVDAFGIIQDEQGNPLSGVTITLGGKVYTSNDLGQVKISQGSAFKEIAFVKAEKAGYFPGSRTFIPQPSVNQFEIRLMQKGTPQSFQADKGAKLTNGELEVEVGEGFIDASGKAYSGQVNAFVRHLAPTDPNILSIMPGALRGADAGGEKVLETYGMLTVELEGSAGQKLQLAENNLATIKAAVPSTLLADAPSTIPLWHFDEEAGIWMHDGEAKLENGSYIGTVTHFSTWNYDIPNSPARLIGKVTGDDGLPIAGLFIDFTRNDRRHSGGRPDNEGNFVAQLPLNTDLTLKITFQGQVVYTESFNTGSNPEFSKEYKIPTPRFAMISGVVLGCNGSMLSSGTLITDTYAAASIIDGKYKFRSLIKAGNTLKLTAIYLYGGISQSRTIEINQSEVVVPAIELCPNNGQTDDFEFLFTMNGTNYAIEGVKSLFEDDSIISFIGGISALDFSTDNDFRMNFNKIGDWKTKNQFKIGVNGRDWNGGLRFDLGDGIKYYADHVYVNILSRSPYQIDFSGTMNYFDENTNTTKSIQVTNGKIIEK